MNTFGKSVQSPVHLHVGDYTPVHVHIDKPQKPNYDSKMSSKQLRFQPKKQNNKSFSLKPKYSWQGKDRRLDVITPVLNAKEDEEDSEESSGFVEAPLPKMSSGDLEGSQRILRDKQKQLEMYKKELEHVEQENDKLKRNMEEICQDVQLSVIPEKKFNDTLFDLPEKKYFRTLNENQIILDSMIDKINILSDKIKFSNINKDELCNIMNIINRDAKDLSISNGEIRLLFRQLIAFEIDCVKLREQNDYMLSKIASLEDANSTHRQGAIKSNLEIEELKMKLDSLQDSSETNRNLEVNLRSSRAHLQNQLKLKEGECNRLSVQLKIIENEAKNYKMEMEKLKVFLNETQTKLENDKISLKKETKANRLKASTAEKVLTEQKEKFINTETELNRYKHDFEQLNKHVENILREKQEAQMELKDFKIRVLELENLMEKASKDKNEISVDHRNTTHDGEASMENIPNEYYKQLQTLKMEIENLKLQKNNFQNKKQDELETNMFNKQVETKEKEESYLLLQERINSLEEKNSALEEQNHALNVKNAQIEEANKHTKVRLAEKGGEIATLQSQIDNMVDDLKKQKYLQMDQLSATTKLQNSQVMQLEQQLGQMKLEISKLTRDKQESERKYNNQVFDLKERLEQSASTNRTMHNYLQFLKNSYARAFNDPSIVNVSPFVI